MPTSNQSPASHSPPCPLNSLRHLELARQSNYADTWHWAREGEEGRRPSFGSWWWHLALAAWTRARAGCATICTHLKSRRRAANEPQVVAIATNAKNGPSKLTTSEKEAQLYAQSERERKRESEGEAKGARRDILMKASSDAACKWPRQGRKWKQTAITKGKARKGDKISKKKNGRIVEDCSSKSNKKKKKKKKASGSVLWFCQLKSFDIKVAAKSRKLLWRLFKNGKNILKNSVRYKKMLKDTKRYW